MNKIREAYIEKLCPTSGKKEKIWYSYIIGTSLFACNGCENANGSTTCAECISQVNKDLRES